MQICRPEKITCRWVKEITEAISNVCIIEKPFCKDNKEAEKIWNEFLFSLQKSKCLQNKNVKEILAFEVDYNFFRK